MPSLTAKTDSIWPQILAQEITENQASLHCLIPPQLLYFDGHMQDRPILPGIAQVHWAACYGHEFFSIKGHFLRLEAVKFQQVILPENQVHITLQYNEDNAKLSFNYQSDRGGHSSGRICFSR